MKKISIALAIYFAFILIWSILFDDSLTGRFLSIETNIWIIRLIYGVFLAIFIFVYFKQKKSSARS